MMGVRDEHEYDSSTTRSSTSMDLLHQSKPHATSEHSQYDTEYKHTFPFEKHSNSAKRLTTSWKTSRFRAGRRQSLVQCLENKITKPHLRTKHRYIKSNYPSTLKPGLSCNEYINKGCGDLPEDRNERNQVHLLYPAFIRQKADENKADEESSYPDQKFPFKTTPSGHYKLKPNQIVYNSKNLSILAADPHKVLLNVTDSTKNIDTDSNKMTGNVETRVTACPYSRTNEKGGFQIGSEFSDSVSESDGGMLPKTSGRPSEISLDKMGFVADNCIDWNEIELPKKADLYKLITQNINNKINHDIQIKIGNSLFNCHRIVLQSYSSLDFSSKSGPVIELPADIVPKDIFPLIYQWMLDKDSDRNQILRRDNVLKLYNASKYLKVKDLEIQCLAFIDNVKIFFEDKAFLLYYEASKYGNKDIMELMVPRVQRFFLTLVSSKEFVELPFEEVCTFLNSNHASIHNELEMFMAAVRWLSHQWTAREPVAVDIMRCVRFKLINLKRLLLMLRTKQKQPLEIERIVNIPDVAKMMDDAITYHTIKNSNEKKPEEEFEKDLKLFQLTHPISRNWSGTHKEYNNYYEFLKELSLYRSKHRLDIKQSRMQMHMIDLDDNDFLNQAVLPETTHERFNQLKSAHRIHPSNIPKLHPKEQEELKKVLYEGERETEEHKRVLKTKHYPKAEQNCIRYSPCRNRELRKQRASAYVERKMSKEELDVAARKIQKAYRGYVAKKESSVSFGKKAVRDQNLNSTSDPNLKPCSLVKSNVQPKVKAAESRLTLHTGVETVFTFGGFNFFDNPLVVDTGSMIYKYIIESNSWVKCGELPSPKHYHGVCLYRGKIYVAGGKNPSQLSNNGVSRKVWCYDPDYNMWSRVADMHHPRRSFGFVVCCNRMFVVGGRDNKGRILSSVEKYDLATESWIEARPMLEPRTGAGICEFRGAIWAAGGIGLECKASRTVEHYDYKTNTWSYFAPLRFDCAFSVLLPMGGRLYLVGGAIGLQGELQGSSRHVDVLDPETDTWCLSSTMSKCRHGHAAVHMRGVPQSEPSHLLVLGGMMSRNNKPTDNVECWREHDDVYVKGLAPLPCPMTGFCALVLHQRTFC